MLGRAGVFFYKMKKGVGFLKPVGVNKIIMAGGLNDVLYDSIKND